MSERRCSVEGCNNRHMARSLCSTHYNREKNAGNLDEHQNVRQFGINSGYCNQQGCDSPARCRGMCQFHYRRWKRYGDPQHAAIHPRWVGLEASYATVHDRIRYRRGAAKNHCCVLCGDRAHSWAYDGSDPEQKFGPTAGGKTWCFYSLDIFRYQPLCAKCHMPADKAKAREELREYREWKHRTGLTLDQVDLLLQGKTA